MVGGGIAGLSAAWEATRSGEVEVTVLEADERLGGRIRTSDIHGVTVDEGADAFLARVPWGIDLCSELGLTDELVSPAARNAFVYSRGELRPLPTQQVLGVPLDLEELADVGIVSTEGLDEARRTIASSGPETNDDTIAAVLRRQVGAEVADRLVDPLVGGINAGDTTQLSLRAVVPQLASAAEHPDGLVAGLLEARAANPPDLATPVFHGLPGGTDRLINVLGRRLEEAGATVRTDSNVEAISRTAAGSFQISVSRRRGPRTGSGESIDTDTVLEADRIVLATPALVTADLIGPAAPDSAAGLLTIDHASVALVTVIVSEEDVGRTLDGSGFLVPRPEGLDVTACSWASSKWEHLGGDRGIVLRASIGRAGHASALDLDDGALVEVVRQDLATTMDLSGEPLAVRVSRWPRSFPQYAPGHLDLVDRIDADLDDRLPGLALAGWTYRGIGIPASIHSGRQAARHVLA